MTDGYSWQNWDQKKSPDSREIRIIEVGLYQRTVLMVKYRPSKNQLQRWIYLHNKLIRNMIKLKRSYLVDSKWYDNREKLFKSTLLDEMTKFWSTEILSQLNLLPSRFR